MKERERQHCNQPTLQPDIQPSAARAALHADAERLLAAGDEAIDRVLSGDSQAFLAANQQTGGQ